ncbi:MAG: TOPRIM nucleotidyl transferase/hydrolase domain-containing protein [Betaproteobacteria bacterium]
MGAATTIRTLVLVEGDSDAGAVRALADLIGCDFDMHHIQVWSADGVTNFSRVLSAFVREHPAAKFCGMYDVADERHVRRALSNAGAPVAAEESLETAGFFACVTDLEDELIRALGAEAVERVIEAQAELTSFRRFQAMPQHRGTLVHHQLRRFLGTRATRKIRSAQRLVEACHVARLPYPLAQLAEKLREAASHVPHRGRDRSEE